jgi:hypothetical protein
MPFSDGALDGRMILVAAGVAVVVITCLVVVLLPSSVMSFTRSCSAF